MSMHGVNYRSTTTIATMHGVNNCSTGTFTTRQSRASPTPTPTAWSVKYFVIDTIHQACHNPDEAAALL